MGAKKEREMPHVGRKYRKNYKGTDYTVEVVKSGERIGFKLKGKTYASLSAAAKSLTTHEENGWAFWKAD